MKPKVPTEAEVRRFFQEAYYTTYRWDSESQGPASSNDPTQMIYPVEKDDDEPTS